MPLLNILYTEEERWLKLRVAGRPEEECRDMEVCAGSHSALEFSEHDNGYDSLSAVYHPGINRLEPLRRARALSHRLNTPSNIIPATEFRPELVRAGDVLFLRRPERTFAIVCRVVKLTARS
jgi:hypothetical protein